MNVKSISKQTRRWLYLGISQWLFLAGKIVFLNPFHATNLFLYPPKSIKKSPVFWHFQGVWKETSGMKWVQMSLILWTESFPSCLIQLLPQKFLSQNGKVMKVLFWNSNQIGLISNEKKMKCLQSIRTVFNPFSTSVPLMDKPGDWFLLAKCLKNTRGRVIF